MNKLTTFIVLVVLFASCKTSSLMNTSGENSHNWAGVYRGIFPCADCPGIKMELTLNVDQSFVLKSFYMESENDAVYTESGSFSWNKSGNILKLATPDSTWQQYLISENQLTKLDINGKLIKSPLVNRFMLTKVNCTIDSIKITGTYWKLVELNGTQLSDNDMHNKEPYLILTENENRVTGNTGCNSLSGIYELDRNNQIHFSKLITTRMACLNMTIETPFLKAIEAAKTYEIKEDTLRLYGEETSPLAGFKMVYLK